MGIIGKFISLGGGEDPRPEISKIVPLAECSAEECSSCDMNYPSSVSNIDTKSPLWNNTSVWALQILIATGKTDWIHTISDEPNSLAKALSEKHKLLEKKAGGLVKINNCSAVPPGEEQLAEFSWKLLLLPYFLYITDTDYYKVVDDVISAIDAFQNKSFPWLSSDLKKEAQLSATAEGQSKIVPSFNKGFVLLCSHRTRDKRCGITAPILKKEFDIRLRQEDLYRDAHDDRPGGIEVFFVNHVGGHKFNANCMIYLRSGESLWMARVKPNYVEPIVEKTILEGKVFPELMRQAMKGETIPW